MAQKPLAGEIENLLREAIGRDPHILQQPVVLEVTLRPATQPETGVTEMTEHSLGTVHVREPVKGHNIHLHARVEHVEEPGTTAHTPPNGAPNAGAPVGAPAARGGDDQRKTLVALFAGLAIGAVLLAAILFANGSLKLPDTNIAQDTRTPITGDAGSGAGNAPAYNPPPVQPRPAPRSEGRTMPPTDCDMTMEHTGERGYDWGDGQCHRIPPPPQGRATAQSNARLVVGSAAASERFEVGEKCPMSGKRKGEQGWVWPDGDCHHIPYKPRRQ